jgi:hypothetical protein
MKNSCGGGNNKAPNFAGLALAQSKEMRDVRKAQV